MGRTRNDGLLARVNFPLYSVEMLTSRHVLVAGGGGEAKTGVANGFEIYEIYHNGQKFVAKEVIRHETDKNVVMNCAVRNNGHHSYLVAGQESHCQLYHVSVRVVKDEDDDIETLRPISSDINRRDSAVDENLRQRRRTSSIRNATGPRSSGSSDANQNEESDIRFEIRAGDLTQTDFSERDPFQRVVRISPNCKLMATGGCDAHVRIWSFPQMIQTFDIDVHRKEIDDLDFSPDSKQLVSIAKDGLAIIWNVSTGEKCSQLMWSPPNNAKFAFKRCRFGPYEGRRGQHRLFTISNPVIRTGPQVSYLQDWSPDNGSLVNSAKIDESLASLAVRDDGRFVAVGTMVTGSVSIYIAFSLQRVLHIPAAHSTFVTGLQFLPSKDTDGPPISSDSEAAVLSISADNNVSIHSLRYRHTIPAWLAVFMIVSALVLVFMLCSYLGL